MKGDSIPESDTISRYCSYTKISETGKPLGAAFRLKSSALQSENPHISVNWLEFFNDKDREGQIEEIRTILSKKMKGGIGGQAKLALLKVAAIYDYFGSSNYNIRVLHWPDRTDDYDDPSHAGIFDVGSDPDVIADMIAQVASELVPTKVEQA